MFYNNIAILSQLPIFIVSSRIHVFIYTANKSAILVNEQIGPGLSGFGLMYYGLSTVSGPTGSCLGPCQL